MILCVSYAYDTEKREFLSADQLGEEGPACRDIGYMHNPSPDGRKWDISNAHGVTVRTKYEGQVDQLVTLVSEGTPELIAALNASE